ncbi:MAG: serine hydrolase [Clostridia bacterium]|nr:serine hydrolase [Clostridia bacterium]
MDFSKLAAYLDSIPALGVPGCDMAVYRDHRLLFRHSAGYRDEEKTQPVRPDDTYNLYSCSKVTTSCAAMRLIEQGALALDAPVSDYLPAYRRLTVRDGDAIRPARNVMTVRHLLSMQSGLDYDLDTPAIRRVLKETDGRATTRQLAEAKAEDPLMFEPGTDFLYSASHDVLAAVIEAAAGEKFSDYLRKNIWEPLGMKTVCFLLPEKERGRQCAQYVYNPEANTFDVMPREALSYRLTPNFESGGAGLISDIRDYAVFLDALACEGKAEDGCALLSPETIQLWNANQLCPKGRASFDGWKRLGYSYALGVRTRVTLAAGGRGSLGEFGWDGAAGAWAMIDPATHVSAIYLMHVRNYGYGYDVIHPTLRNLIYEGLE